MPFDRRGALAKEHDSGRSLLDGAPRFLFLAAVILAAFAVGWRVRTFEIFPHAILFNAYKTAKTHIEFSEEEIRKIPALSRGEFVNVVPDRVEAHRFEFVAAAALTDPILVPGGFGRFAEYCPGHAGCLAVEYADNGAVVHAYPYRPEEIEKTPPLLAFPYEQTLGFRMRDAGEIWSTSQYANGDLSIVFHSWVSHPFGLGIARIDREGRPIWYRRDYSHHKVHLTGDAVALVPSMRIGKMPNPYNFLYKKGFPTCQSEGSYLDFIHIINGEGHLLRGISILDVLLESPYAPILQYADSCDPTHLNSVHELDGTAGGGGIGPGDLVVSLRNLSAFAILDGGTHRLKRLLRGGFFGQHSVVHLEGSRFLMFDNWGREGRHGPSRLLMVDVADGTETTIFPNDSTPEHLRNLHSKRRGGVSISPDRRRVFLTFTLARKAVEVRISDGAVLTVFNFLHDVSHLDSLSEERKTRAVTFRLQTIRYIDSGGSRGTGISQGSKD